MTDDERLTEKARASIEQAISVFVSPISLYEISRKVHRGKWPEMGPYVDRLPDLLDQQECAIAAMDAVVATRAGAMAWAHRDPFDRLLAATALRFNLPIVSADPVFDGVVARIW